MRPRDLWVKRAFGLSLVECLWWIGFGLVAGYAWRCYSESVTLAWNPNSETNLAGYKVHVGESSRIYGAPLTASNTSITVSNLLPGRTYYFAATAFTLDGLESDFSEEITFTPAGERTIALKAILEASDALDQWIEVTNFGAIALPTNATSFYRVRIEVTP